MPDPVLTPCTQKKMRNVKMENKTSSEQVKQLKDTEWGKYIIFIWNGAVLFFLIDLLFGSFIAIIVYVVMKAILWFGQPWTTIPAEYLSKTILLFCLIYLISLAIVAWWRHFRLIIHRSKRIGNGGTANQR